MCVCVQLDVTVGILFNTSLRVSDVPCPSSGDAICPGQQLVMLNEPVVVSYGVRYLVWCGQSFHGTAWVLHSDSAMERATTQKQPDTISQDHTFIYHND
jgi:hypothetical protein